jgi:hypothetical protein
MILINGYLKPEFIEKYMHRSLTPLENYLILRNMQYLDLNQLKYILESFKFAIETNNLPFLRLLVSIPNIKKWMRSDNNMIYRNNGKLRQKITTWSIYANQGNEYLGKVLEIIPDTNMMLGSIEAHAKNNDLDSFRYYFETFNDSIVYELDSYDLINYALFDKYGRPSIEIIKYMFDLDTKDIDEDEDDKLFDIVLSSFLNSIGRYGTIDHFPVITLFIKYYGDIYLITNTINDIILGMYDKYATTITSKQSAIDKTLLEKIIIEYYSYVNICYIISTSDHISPQMISLLFNIFDKYNLMITKDDLRCALDFIKNKKSEAEVSASPSKKSDLDKLQEMEDLLRITQ